MELDDSKFHDLLNLYSLRFPEALLDDVGILVPSMVEDKLYTPIVDVMFVLLLNTSLYFLRTTSFASFSTFYKSSILQQRNDLVLNPRYG